MTPDLDVSVDSYQGLTGGWQLSLLLDLSSPLLLSSMSPASNFQL